MEKITVVCVGKLKERYWDEAVKEYEKRLKSYCTLDIKELADEKTPQGASEALEERILATEGGRILKASDSSAFFVALDIKGKSFSSEEFAAFMEERALNSAGRTQFVIGGSLGLSKEVLKEADLRMSFSGLTFPHQMARVILLEQIYRSYRIRMGEPYHK